MSIKGIRTDGRGLVQMRTTADWGGWGKGPCRRPQAIIFFHNPVCFADLCRLWVMPECKLFVIFQFVLFMSENIYAVPLKASTAAAISTHVCVLICDIGRQEVEKQVFCKAVN